MSWKEPTSSQYFSWIEQIIEFDFEERALYLNKIMWMPIVYPVNQHANNAIKKNTIEKTTSEFKQWTLNIKEVFGR